MANKESTYSRQKMGKVCYLYYHYSLNQKQIADILGVSSNTVSRILDEAKEQKVVKFEIDYKYPRNPYLESVAGRLFSPTQFIALQSDFLNQSDNEKKMEVETYLAESAAFYLSTLLPANKENVVGVGGGKTLSKLANSIYPSEEKGISEVVQLIGGLGKAVNSENSATVIQQICKRLNVPGVYFLAPALVDEGFGEPEMISKVTQQTKDRWGEVNVALMGIGGVGKNSTVFSSELFEEEELEHLLSRGAVGDIGLHFFDINGKLVDKQLDKRVLGVNLEELREIPRLIAVAGGKKKRKAIKGALNSNLIDILITLEDDLTEVLDLVSKSPRPLNKREKG